MDWTQRRIGEILGGLTGVAGVGELDRTRRDRVVELETRYELSSALPIRNVGVGIVAQRTACWVILKDGSFRQPLTPTVYLVEDGTGEDGENGLCAGERAIVVEGKSYRVVGEEVVGGRKAYGEAVILLDESFVIFPDRRSGARVPCSFILPPIPFPELERRAESFGISDVVSISPSLVSDSFLRETFGFPSTNAFATLLIGFNFTRGRSMSPWE